jgi:hypothetical protein
MAIDPIQDSGEIETPAAVEQQFEQNSYQKETQDEGYLTPSLEQESATPQAKAESVPLEDPQVRNFKALQESVEQLKAEREAEKREHQLQLEMLRANATKPAQDKPKKIFEELQDTDIPNVGEFRKAWEERERLYNEKIEELQIASKYPDYADVLNKYGKHLADTDPAFLQGIRGAENKALFAYQYAKKEQRLQDLEAQLKSPQIPSQKSVDTQRMVENARKPGTLAQTGGQSVLSKADYYANMSDTEFLKMAAKHMDQI